MKSIIITKWIEPYKLLETIKEDYTYQDFTFDTISKNIEKKKFLKELESSQYSIGLYMKNVNKYYLFKKDCEFDVWSKLEQVFDFTDSDFIIDTDLEQPFNMVDLGKAEAGIIFA
ncbi:hypothetical protein HDR58_09370 [bacterium]|nr:hypothetical protein [bacterium]